MTPPPRRPAPTHTAPHAQAPGLQALRGLESPEETTMFIIEHRLPSGTVIRRDRDEPSVCVESIDVAVALCAAPPAVLGGGPLWVVVPGGTSAPWPVLPALFARRVQCPTLPTLPHAHILLIREREEGGPRWGGSSFRAVDGRDPIGLARTVLPHEASDHELASALAGAYGQGEPQRVAAAEEWMQRYPDGAASRSGSKQWALDADRVARGTLAA